MAPKKGKLKKMLSSSNSAPPPVEDSIDEDALIDDLLAQLDIKHRDVRQEPTTVPNDVHANQIVAQSNSAAKKDSKARFKARQARKTAALADSFAPTDAEADARQEHQAKEEDTNIKRTCEELGLIIYEITPDGHCLFSAVADQLGLLGIIPSSKASYAICRTAAADYIETHPDDFLPFLPSEAGEDAAGAAEPGFMNQAQFARYCSAMRSTAAWGGEPEILALSRTYNVTIHVVQGGTPPVVIHSPSGQESTAGNNKTVYISYHRRLYGLGEHYNSLRPKTLVDTIKAAFH